MIRIDQYIYLQEELIIFRIEWKELLLLAWYSIRTRKIVNMVYTNVGWFSPFFFFFLFG